MISTGVPIGPPFLSDAGLPDADAVGVAGGAWGGRRPKGGALWETLPGSTGHIYLSTNLPIHPSIHLSTYLPTVSIIYLSICLSVYLSIYLPIYLYSLLPWTSLREVSRVYFQFSMYSNFDRIHLVHQPGPTCDHLQVGALNELALSFFRGNGSCHSARTQQPTGGQPGWGWTKH